MRRTLVFARTQSREFFKARVPWAKRTKDKIKTTSKMSAQWKIAEILNENVKVMTKHITQTFSWKIIYTSTIQAVRHSDHDRVHSVLRPAAVGVWSTPAAYGQCTGNLLHHHIAAQPIPMFIYRSRGDHHDSGFDGLAHGRTSHGSGRAWCKSIWKSASIQLPYFPGQRQLKNSWEFSCHSQGPGWIWREFSWPILGASWKMCICP